MRTLLALALVILGGALVLNAPAVNAADKAKGAETKRTEGKRAETKRTVTKRRPKQYAYSREAVECERAEHADPTGRFRDFPCWAREALSPQHGGADRK